MYEYPEESMEQTPVENLGQIEKDGYYYSADEYGHARVAERDENGGMLRWRVTDPYHHLSYSFGYEVTDQNGMVDFLICLDFLVLEAHVAFHVVRDSDSGGFIETADYVLVRHNKAVEDAGNWAYWAMDEVYNNYYMNVASYFEDEPQMFETLDPEADNYPPNDEEFRKIRDKFIKDVRQSLAHTPAPVYGYPNDEGI